MTDARTKKSQTAEVTDSNGDGVFPCPLPTSGRPVRSLDQDLRQGLAKAGCPLAPSVEERVQFETLLSELSSRFVNLTANEVDSQIEAGLRRIVECLGIDRSGFGELSANGRQFFVTHSYQVPGVPPAPRQDLFSLFPIYSEMIRQGKVVRVPDDLPAEATAEREYCRRVGLKFNLTIPLTLMGSVVGGIGFASFGSRRELPDELLPRLRLLGDVFSNALARKRADEALRDREQMLQVSQTQLRDLAARLLHAQEQERRRIAREMHDDWTQRLAVLGIDVARLERQLAPSGAALELIETIRKELVSLSEDVHGLSRQLHPAILDDLGLVEALRSECASLSRRGVLRVEYVSQLLPHPIPHDAALCAYRIAQESLRNVARHSGGREAAVSLLVDADELLLRIQDWGAGFDPRTVHHGPGLGLSSMAERVKLVQGKLAVRSAPGEGTTIEVRLPLVENPSA
ncbi:MAG: GAF domain-containing sensor histidine kinase [Pirellulaceae bacterium]|nr:GAF domain-containing sensor histidine kinase [Pirellulaceae bacterium]